MGRQLQTRGAFDIAPRTRYYYEGGSKYAAVPGRFAQTYVFAWNLVCAPDTDHRDPDQWEFHVVPVSMLPEGQKTIGLSKIQRLNAPVRLTELGLAISHVGFPSK